MHGKCRAAMVQSDIYAVRKTVEARDRNLLIPNEKDIQNRVCFFFTTEQLPSDLMLLQNSCHIVRCCAVERGITCN